MSDVEICVNNECVNSACKSDGDSDPGKLCIDADCITGRNSQRDCPSGSLCATDEGEHEMCVECIEESDCSDGEKCIDYSCLEFCDQDQDYTQGVCGPESNLCAECIRDDQCDIGFICYQQSCQEGCRKDRDCPSGLVCAQQLGPHGTCVECTADTDCIDQDKPRCLQNRCEPECIQDIDCDNDNVCVQVHCQQPVQECGLRILPAGNLDFGSVDIGNAARLTVTLINGGLSSCGISQLELKENPLWPSQMQIGSQPSLPLVLQPTGQNPLRSTWFGHLHRQFAPLPWSPIHNLANALL